MVYAVLRIFRFSWENVWRNFWLAVVTTSTLVLTLLSVSLVVGLQAGISQVISAAESRINLSVYFYPTATEEQINSVITALRGVPGVGDIAYISKEQALARYQEQAKGAPELLDPLQAIGQNPFGASLSIKADGPSAFARLADEVGKPQYKDLVEGQKNQYEENQTFIANFRSFTGKVWSSALTVSGVFALIAILLIFNAIRVAIYTHREEVAVMKLVGATNWFVRAPFLVETFIYSLAAVLVTAAIVYGGLTLVQPALGQYFAGDVDLLRYFHDNGLLVFGLELAGTLVLNTLAGTLALSRYLKV